MIVRVVVSSTDDDGGSSTEKKRGNRLFSNCHASLDQLCRDRRALKGQNMF